MSRKAKPSDRLWNARVRYWPWNIRVTARQARDTAESLAARRVNVVIVNHDHFRWNAVDLFPRIEEATRKIVDACHEQGILVVEHHSSTATSNQGRYKRWRIENWANRDVRTGKIGRILIRHGPQQYDAWWCCINNPHWRRAYYEYITGFFSKTGVDGLMHDDIHFVPGWFHCGCHYCRQKFLRLFGYELPRGKSHSAWENFGHQVWRDWIRFRLMSTGDEFVDIADAIGKDKLLFGCCSVGAGSTLAAHDAGYTYESFARGANILYQECSSLARNELPPSPYHFYNWKRHLIDRKYYQALSQVTGSPCLAYYYPASKAEGFFCWALTKLCGHGYIAGPDHPERCFRWERDHEQEYRRPRELANVGIVFSAATMAMAGADSKYFVDEWRGWCEAMLDGHVPFRVVLTDTQFNKASLKGLDLLILPNVTCLSDEQVRLIRSFVRCGGRLILTHESGLCDETGQPREDFALADMLGVHYERTVRGVDLSMFTGPTGSRVLGVETGRLEYSGPQVMVRGTQGKHIAAGAWIDKYNVFDRRAPYPAAIEGTYGKGSYLYLSFKPGLMYATEGLYMAGSGDYSGRFVAQARRKGAKATWVDESIGKYGNLVLSCVRRLAPDTGWPIRVHAPQGVAVCQYATMNGDIVVNFLNASGATLEHGRVLPSRSAVRYPPLPGAQVRISATARQAGGAYAVSPDFAGVKRLRVDNRYGCARVAFDASLVKRFLTVHMVTR